MTTIVGMSSSSRKEYDAIVEEYRTPLMKADNQERARLLSERDRKLTDFLDCNTGICAIPEDA